MKHIYNPTKAAYTQRSSAKAMGTAAASKIFSLLLLSFFLLVGGESVGQNKDPRITYIEPNCALQGQNVVLTISGTDFKSDASDNAARVEVNGLTPYIVPSTTTPTSITVFVPYNYISGSSFDVRVRQKGSGNDFVFSNRMSVNLISLTALPGQRCQPGPVTLTASGTPAGGNFLWYDGADRQVGSGATFTTPSLEATTTYYVQIINGSCETVKVPVKAIIGDMLPVASGSSRCNPGVVTLTASGAPSGGSYRWYDADGTPVGGIGGSFTTPSLNVTTTYYVSVVSDCESPKVPVIATIGGLIKPTLSSDGDCGNGNPTITVTASGAATGQVYRWYEVPTGGSPVSTGSTFSRPRNSNRSYYVSIYDENEKCEGDREEFVITNQAPGAPVPVNGSRCGRGRVVLSASGAGAYQSYHWYTAQSGGTLVGEGATFVTPILEVGTTRNYYVSVVNTLSKCDGQRALVTATALEGGSTVATGDIVPPANPVVGQPAIFTLSTNIPSEEIESYLWSYHIAGTSDNIWETSNTPALSFQEMPNIDKVKVEVKVKEENALCYADLPSTRVLLVNDIPITPLPVELISFNARRDTKGVMLTWATASELENKGFEVQVSTDARKFMAIGFVESKVGTTSLQQNYKYLDTRAVSGTRYYRLKQVDFDGTTAFSPVKAVVLNEGNNKVSAYPNPFDDAVVVTLNGTEARNVQVVLMDAMGKVLQQRTEETSGNSITVDMRSITSKGMYVLHVLDNDTKHTFKLMKR